MLPLGLLTTGEKAEVLKIRTIKHQNRMNRCCVDSAKNESDGINRMEDMGLRTGKTVEMINNAGKGPLLLKLDNSRIALSRGIAMNIIVKKTEQ